MNMQISVSYHTMPQNVILVSQFLKTLKLKKNTMLLFSKGCYEFIKQISLPFGEKLSPVYSKIFAQIRDDIWINDYFSFIPLYSGEWFYMESFNSKSINFDSIDEFPKEIKFISLADEFIPKDIKVTILKTPKNENSLDCIIYDHDKFENSLIILTDQVFKKLKSNTTITSYHKGFYRLKYDYDYANNYPGGFVTLKSFNKGNYFLVENMMFSFFTNIFSITGFPNEIFFII